MTPPPAAGALTELDAVRAALADDYADLEELGRGGMAVVFRAHERALDRDVAVKVLPAAFTFDAEFVERFQREARMAASLEHPHIVPVYRVGRSGHVVYFVMKLLRGQSLSARLRERGPLPAAEVRRVLVETAGALGYAHRRGVVHRDVKPDNVMHDEDDRCVVTDFGIAKSGAEQGLTATGMSVGTPRYMSPEQARARTVDGRSDLYSLGVVGYECLTGATPFGGEDAFAILMAHVSAPLPRPALRTPEERQLFAVLERMLAKRPEDRYQSADEVIAALGGVTVGTGAGPVYAPRPAPAPPPADVDDEPSGPTPSPALDAALAAGIALLREQRPRVQAAAGAGLDAAARLAAGVRDHGAPLVARARTHAPSLAARGRDWARGRGRAFWLGAVGATLAVVAAYYAAHFALHHRSRCPQPAPVAAGSRGAPGASRLSLLVDAPGAQRAGGDLELYYDVCGLDEGDTFTTEVAVRRHGSGLKRLLGGSSEELAAMFDDRASGPATRRHRTIELPDAAPGAYTLEVVVATDAGRRRERAVSFQVR